MRMKEKDQKIKTDLRTQRIHSYAFAFFCVMAVSDSFWVIYNAVNHRVEFFLVLILLVAFVFLDYLLVKQITKHERNIPKHTYAKDEYEYLRACSDQYIKRLYNSIAFLICAVFILVNSELSLFLFGISKPAELIECYLSNVIIVLIPLFLLLKNTLLSCIIKRRIGFPDTRESRRYEAVISSFSIAYWTVVTLATVILRNRISARGDILMISGIVFFVILIIVNLTLRRRVTYKNFIFNKRRAALVLAVILVFTFTYLKRENWYTTSYIESVSEVPHNTHRIEYNEDTGVYTITSSTEDFKILHLTDIHLGGSLSSSLKDLKALEACYAEIQYTRPDLVIVTGDLCFPLGIMSMSLNNSAPIKQFAAFMERTGIPWAFTYGNHDTESISALNDTELDEVFQSLSYKTSGTLLYPYTQPDIMGRNNQIIDIRNSDGTLNTALVLIDSNTYTGNGINDYDYIHDDQVEWYESEIRKRNEEAGHTINSLVFFHIPLQEYRTATELYLAGSSEVQWYFGENPGDHGGITNDQVCCSDYPSKLFDTAYSLGSTTGFFCGHDHYNNASLEYMGIRLTYGMSIDYLAMPGIENETKQRGAELITLHPDGSWDLEQIPLDSIT